MKDGVDRRGQGARHDAGRARRRAQDRQVRSRTSPPTRACPYETVTAAVARLGQGRSRRRRRRRHASSRPARTGSSPGSSRTSPTAGCATHARPLRDARGTGAGQLRPRPQSKTTTWRRPVAGAQPVEGGLEVVEADPAVDEPVDRQPPVEVERRVAREVDRRVGEAVVRAEDPPAAVDERVDRERGARPRTASSRRGRPSRRAAGLDREFDGRDPADGLEDEVRAAVGQVAQRRDRLGRVRRRRGGRPWRRPSARRRASPSTRSMATIRDGAGEDRAHHARQPDAAEPDDRHASRRPARRPS